MSLFVVEVGMKRAHAAVAAALLMGGCGASPSAGVAAENVVGAESAVSPTSGPTPIPASATASPQAGVGAEPSTATLAGVSDDDFPGTETPREKMLGRWTVIDVASSQAGTFINRSMAGRTLSFTDGELGWIGRDGKVEAKDRCASPAVAIIPAASTVRELAKPFRPAWARFALPARDVGPMHEWMCDPPSSTEEAIFGPDAGSNFFPVGDDRMVMNWYDDTVLLLRRAD